MLVSYISQYKNCTNKGDLRVVYWIPKETKLLVTSRLHGEYDAASEVWHALRASGVCENAEVRLVKRGREWIRGLIAFVFEGDPLEAVLKIKSYFMANQWIMEFTERIYPIEFVTDSLSEASKYLTGVAEEKIGDSRWKIHVFKHSAELKRLKVIESLAEAVKVGKVDLENPEWIITVHIIKNNLALAVVKPDHLVRKKDIRQTSRWRDLVFLGEKD